MGIFFKYSNVLIWKKGPCLSFFSFCSEKNTWTKAVCKEKGFILAHSSRYSKHIAAGKGRRRELKAAGGVATMIESREVVVVDFFFPLAPHWNA